MLRIILIIVLLLLAAVGGIAVVLFKAFDWKGLIAFPFLLIGMLWLGKIIIGRALKKFALSLFSMKAGVLRGATMTVHSIAAVPKPSEPEPEPEPESTDSEEESDAEDAEEAGDDAEEIPEPEEPKHYYAVEMTITPKGGQDQIWEPGEFILTSQKLKSLEDLEGENEVGTTHEVLIWNGSAFGSDEEGKYPGVQRLKVTFEVKPGTSTAWLHYYNEPIGTLELPAWNVNG
jgi:hypothetical protein